MDELIVNPQKKMQNIFKLPLELQGLWEDPSSISA